MVLSLNTVTQPVVKNFSRQKKAQVRRANFEGGYSQRSSVGPNSLGKVLRLTWVQATALNNEIDAFLTARKGVEAFYYQLPGEPQATLWSCQEWSDAPAGPDGSQLDAVFRQEFDII